MRPRWLHRWWLLNAVWGCVLIAWEAVLLALGLHGAWLLLPTVPVTAVQFVGWRKTRPVRPRPDYGRIAVLESELLGIEPEPGTAAAAVVGFRQALGEARAYLWLASEFRMCDHERTEEVATLGGGRWLLCRDCGARADMTSDR